VDRVSHDGHSVDYVDNFTIVWWLKCVLEPVRSLDLTFSLQEKQWVEGQANMERDRQCRMGQPGESHHHINAAGKMPF
jgi:hypothetical protein